MIEKKLICHPDINNTNEYSLWKLERYDDKSNKEIIRLNILLKQLLFIIKSTSLSKGAKNVLHSVFENHLLAKCLRDNNPIWAGNLNLIMDDSFIESCIYWLFPTFKSHKSDIILENVFSITEKDISYLKILQITVNGKIKLYRDWLLTFKEEFERKKIYEKYKVRINQCITLFN